MNMNKFKYVLVVTLVTSVLFGGSVALAAKGGVPGKPVPPDDGGDGGSHPPIVQPFF